MLNLLHLIQSPYNVDAVFHDDVELNGNGFVLVIDHVDALAHGLPPQQVHKTVRHGAVGHALHAEAVGGGHAGDVGKNSAGDGDLPLFRMEFQHNWITFLSVGPGKPPSGHSYQAIIIYDFSQKYKSKNAIKPEPGRKTGKSARPPADAFYYFSVSLLFSTDAL